MVQEDVKCYHCGQACDDRQFTVEDKNFCCYGCKVVFEIINENNLCAYYDYEQHPGATVRQVDEEAYAYLEENAVQQKLLEFQSTSFSRVRFRVPAIHCVSCIWLLENLRKLDHGILRSEVNFARKSVVIDFNPERVSLKRVAGLMASVGYAPQIQLSSEQIAKPVTTDRLVSRLAVAGFCFGNVMLFSFPEYLGLDHNDALFQRLFPLLNLGLSIPVLIFSSRDYFYSAWKSFSQRQINIDVPIAAGLVALFFRSAWDILTGFGPGYLDSFTGLVFFLLIGRWFQSKTYESLAFDRDFKSYFPLAIRRWVNGNWKPVIIYELDPGDKISVRNLEIIPADSRLEKGEAYIDYSFVTGESRPALTRAGDRVYAGGRLIGQPATFVVEKKTSQSHLTTLWNHEAFRKKEENKYQRTIDRAARAFTWVVLLIALVTGLYWYAYQPTQMWLVLTSVLMVACPCALALAAPFTYGSMLRAFGRNQLYLKNADVIERMAAVNAVVFDKTGTVTHGTDPEVTLEGVLSQEELSAVKKLTSFSTHPLSKVVSASILGEEASEAGDFMELPGKGIEGRVDRKTYRIGSAEFTGAADDSTFTQARVWVAVDGEVRGYFRIQTNLREGIYAMIYRLGNKCAGLLSGDNDGERSAMAGLFGPNAELRFNQNPHDKREYIEQLQSAGKKVLMVGDGLNDAGALKQSDVGISVTDDTGVFTPSSDGILKGERVEDLDKFIRLAQRSAGILKAAFAISFLYNAIALSFAVTGHLTPLVAAILMPISSISVVSFASVSVRIAARLERLN
ncbi:MAG: heavy metal translocating P-type ATPase metal-binding domain-containing protein [Cyclobacteriaceae bacterium]|nr:heavy metal translocating P-type ATPase metal-binding domain-containing protein [Cyclobacteriaceae bacterium]